MKIIEIILILIVGYILLNLIFKKLDKYHYVNKEKERLKDKTLPGFGIWEVKTSGIVILIVFAAAFLYMIIYAIFFIE